MEFKKRYCSKLGRRTKLTRDNLTSIYSNMSKGYPEKVSAELCGVSTRAFNTYKKKGRELIDDMHEKIESGIPIEDIEITPEMKLIEVLRLGKAEYYTSLHKEKDYHVFEKRSEKMLMFELMKKFPEYYDSNSSEKSSTSDEYVQIEKKAVIDAMDKIKRSIGNE